MTECEFVRKAIENGGIAELPEAYREAALDHVSECKECQTAWERAALLETGVTEGLVGVPAASHGRVIDFVREVARRRGLRVGVFALAGAAALAVAGWYGAPILAGWRFPGGDAGPIKAKMQLLGVPGQDLIGVQATGDSIGPWVISKTKEPFAFLDTGVRYKELPSIKLLQRIGSGGLTEHIDVPLPAGTQVTVGAWVLSPRGGGAVNKYFGLSVGSGDGASSADTSVLAASPEWQSPILSMRVANACRGLNVSIGTGAGLGTYHGTDWATWVSDVFVGIDMPLRGSYWEQDGKLVVQAVLPEGYDGSMVEPGTLTYDAYADAPKDSPGTVEGRAGSRDIRLTFADPTVANSLQLNNPDTGGLPVGAVHGRLLYGKYSVPFSCSLTGRVSGTPTVFPLPKDSPAPP